MFGMVERGEYTELSGRVTNLEDIVVHDKLAGPPGAYAPPGAYVTSAAQGGYPSPPVGGDGAYPGMPVMLDPSIPVITDPGSAGSAAPRATGSERARYNRAMSLLKSKRYDQAAQAFRDILTDFPGGKLAPNARYWLGECHYAKGDFSSALQEFQRGFHDYPQSGKAPDYLLKAAYSQSRLGDGPGAMESLRVLLERYPSSNYANLVKSGRSRFPN